MKKQTMSMWVITRNRVPINRVAHIQRVASEELAYIQLHDIPHIREYGMRKVLVDIPKGIRPTTVGLAGRKYRFADIPYMG